MSTTTSERSVTIVRRLAAPPELVFRAWTEPEHLAAWFANPDHPAAGPVRVDLRVGGTWTVEMVESATTAYVTGGVYREIVPGERLVFAWGAVGGWPELDPARPDDVPRVTVRLRGVDGGTELVLLVELADHLDADAVRAWLATGMAEGWAATVDRLARLLG